MMENINEVLSNKIYQSVLNTSLNNYQFSGKGLNYSHVKSVIIQQQLYMGGDAKGLTELLFLTFGNERNPVFDHVGYRHLDIKNTKL